MPRGLFYALLCSADSPQLHWICCCTSAAVTALVPASVRVRREQAPTRPLGKAAPSASGFGLVPRTLQQQKPAAAPAAAAPSVDDKVNAFLAELAGL